MNTPRTILDNFKAMGLQEIDIHKAYKLCNGDQNQMANYLLNQLPQFNADDLPVQNFEILNPIERQRIDQVPVGLKNIGNKACYLNCLLQVYFNIPNFAQQIFAFQYQELAQNKTPTQQLKKEIIRNQKSLQMVVELQQLFAFMVLSDKKYVDPSNVVNNIVDDSGKSFFSQQFFFQKKGNHLSVGDQKDIGEFNVHFLSRVSEALSITQQSQNSLPKQKEKLIQSAILQQGNQQQQNNPTQSMVIQQYQPQDVSESTIRLKGRSEILNIGNSKIQKTFFGALLNTIISEKKNSMLFENKELFSFISIVPEKGELYAALDDAFYQDIQGFKNSKNEVVRAQKQTCIDQSPEVLFFQIQRVAYNFNDSINNDSFNFTRITDQKQRKISFS